VTCESPYEWEAANDPEFVNLGERTVTPRPHFKVVVLDFGVKYNILGLSGLEL